MKRIEEFQKEKTEWGRCSDATVLRVGERYKHRRYTETVSNCDRFHTSVFDTKTTTISGVEINTSSSTRHRPD